MAVAALVHPDRLDKPSLMLAGQPETEVREHSRLPLAVDVKKRMFVSAGSHSIMKIVSHPLRLEQKTLF